MLAREKWQATTISVLENVFEERIRQVKQYGHNEENPHGFGGEWLSGITDREAHEIEEVLREDYENFEERTGTITWTRLIREEVAEAFDSDDPEHAVKELVQVAALCVSLVEDILNKGYLTNEEGQIIP